jgi:hypothetical protein
MKAESDSMRKRENELLKKIDSLESEMKSL